MKEALKGSDTAAIKAASEKLNEAWQSVRQSFTRRRLKRRVAPRDKRPQTWRTRGRRLPGRRKKEEGPIIDAEVVDEKK